MTVGCRPSAVHRWLGTTWGQGPASGGELSWIGGRHAGVLWTAEIFSETLARPANRGVELSYAIPSGRAGQLGDEDPPGASRGHLVTKGPDRSIRDVDRERHIDRSLRRALETHTPKGPSPFPIVLAGPSPILLAGPSRELTRTGCMEVGNPPCSGCGGVPPVVLCLLRCDRAASSGDDAHGLRCFPIPRRKRP